MLLQSQRFALEHIYCAPAQDRQYSFKMARVNKKAFPAIREVTIYGATKKLPNNTSYFQVFTMGNLFPEFLNLQGQKKQWLRDQWVKLSDDMVARNFIAKIYNDDGMMYPRNHVYYSYIDENSLIVALEMTSYLKQRFDCASFVFLNVYSNAYFQSQEYRQLPVRHGIQHRMVMVGNNTEKVKLQNYIASLKQAGGDVFIYVDGHYVNALTLNIPDQSCVEIVYDQSVVERVSFNIQGLRTFDSVKDNKMKYFLFRQSPRDTIDYQDDVEVYIRHKDKPVNKGLLLYRHQDYVMRNVTDKDYSLYTMFVNNTAQTLSQKSGGAVNDKVIELYVRKGGRERPLVYNNMKLHELYKLPFEVQRDVLSNTNYTVDFYRVEQLENSAYFQCASADSVSAITKDLAISAVGYNGITYYYANTPVKTSGALTIEVPELYQTGSLAFEYDSQGLYIGMRVSDGPLYTCSSKSVAYVDFLAGSLPQNYGRLYEHNETIEAHGLECRVLSAFFNGHERVSNWEDITDNPAKCTRDGHNYIVNEDVGKKIKYVCLSHPRVYDIKYPLTSGNIYLTLTQPEDRGNGVANYTLDVPYETIEIYLNGNRLTQGLDFFMKFPHVSVCNKRYLDYTKEEQDIHIRMSGFTLDVNKINAQEVRGFVNSDTLTRNGYYDIRDDKVMAVFVDGKLQDRNSVRYSEEDHTVRVDHPNNGKSYVLREPFIAIKRLTGVDSFPIYRANIEKNKRISELYNLVYPEPKVNEFNAIREPHYLFSPLVSTIVNDIKTGAIPESVYSSPYDDTTIHQLIDRNYKDLFFLDPIRASLQPTLVEIHPHLGNSTIELDLLQYRFVQNVIRLVTKNNAQQINISGYLNLTT